MYTSRSKEDVFVRKLNSIDFGKNNLLFKLNFQLKNFFSLFFYFRKKLYPIVSRHGWVPVCNFWQNLSKVVKFLEFKIFKCY